MRQGKVILERTAFETLKTIPGRGTSQAFLLKSRRARKKMKERRKGVKG
jgi:hypothetical protein